MSDPQVKREKHAAAGDTFLVRFAFDGTRQWPIKEPDQEIDYVIRYYPFARLQPLKNQPVRGVSSRTRAPTTHQGWALRPRKHNVNANFV